MKLEEVKNIQLPENTKISYKGDGIISELDGKEIPMTGKVNR